MTTSAALLEDIGRCFLTIQSNINNDICDKRCGHPSNPAMLDSVCRWSRDENLIEFNVCYWSSTFVHVSNAS